MALFPPQVRPVQPAFINGEVVKIYFSLSSFNTLQSGDTIKYTLIDPNISSTWGTNSKLPSNAPDATTSSILVEPNGEYSITINTSGLNLQINQFYQMQLWLQRGEESSTPSQATLIRPINTFEIPLPSGNVYDLSQISGTTSDPVEVLASISCSVEGYIYNGKCDGQSFIIDMSEHPFIEGREKIYSLTVTYETIHGYKKSTSTECKLLAPNNTTLLTNPIIYADAAAASVNLAFAGGESTDIIERASEENEYATWKQIGYLDSIERAKTSPWRDCTIQSEVKYKYRVTRMNGNTKCAQELTGDPLSVPFEHIILSDKEFLLNLKYNANISGFKYINQESITNTLGGRYPLVRRNGDTDYIQFSLSGLLYVDCTNIDVVSIDSVNNRTDDFIADDKAILYLNDANKIGFTQSNNQMLIERRVREIITRLLTNGRPKLFRSFEEGNLIVYLSGISFTPNKQLGRHIYDFSATVTQLCDYSFENLNKYNLNQNFYIGYMHALNLQEEVVNGVFYDGSVTISGGE